MPGAVHVNGNVTQKPATSRSKPQPHTNTKSRPNQITTAAERTVTVGAVSVGGNHQGAHHHYDENDASETSHHAGDDNDEEAPIVLTATVVPSEDEVAERVRRQVLRDAPSAEIVVLPSSLSQPQTSKEQAMDHDPKQSLRSKRRRNLWIVAALLLLVGGLIGGIVALVASTQGGSDSPTTTAQNPGPEKGTPECAADPTCAEEDGGPDDTEGPGGPGGPGDLFIKPEKGTPECAADPKCAVDDDENGTGGSMRRRTTATMVRSETKFVPSQDEPRPHVRRGFRGQSMTVRHR